MALFGRKKQGDVLPEEVQDYYRAEQRDRMGMAWLLAVGAFIATILVVFGLFFAGRWVYRSLTGNGTDTGTSEQVQTDAEEEGLIDIPETPSPTTNGTTETESENGNGSDSEEAPTTTPASGGNGSDERSPVINGSGSVTELPQTGGNE